MTWGPNYVRPNPRTKYPGVYAIRLKDGGECYVGSSVDMTGRFTHHRFTLRRGTHKNPALQKLWDQHGEDAFEFVVLEPCSKEVLRLREQHWIDATDSVNTQPAKGGGKTGPSPAHKLATKKRWARPDYRAKRQKFLDDAAKAGKFVSQSA